MRWKNSSATEMITLRRKLNLLFRQLVKKFSIFSGTRRFIILLRKIA